MARKPATKPVAKPAVLAEGRTALLLSCSVCAAQVHVSAFLDSTRGDGWPQHRCRVTGRVAAFDRSEADDGSDPYRFDPGRSQR